MLSSLLYSTRFKHEADNIPGIATQIYSSLTMFERYLCLRNRQSKKCIYFGCHKFKRSNTFYHIQDKQNRNATHDHPSYQFKNTHTIPYILQQHQISHQGRGDEGSEHAICLYMEIQAYSKQFVLGLSDATSTKQKDDNSSLKQPGQILQTVTRYCISEHKPGKTRHERKLCIFAAQVLHSSRLRHFLSSLE